MPGFKGSPHEHIERLINLFEASDKELCHHLNHGDLEAAAKAVQKTVSAKRRIKQWLAEVDPMPRLGRELAKKLRLIRDNRGYTIDSLGRLDRSDELDWDFSPEQGFLTGLWLAFTVDVEPDGNPIFLRAARIGSLVVGEQIPPQVARHLQTVKGCFAVGLFDAVVVFCRGLIEAAAYHFLEERNDLPGGPKSGSFDLLVRLEAHKQAWMVDKAQKIRKLANDILHDKRRAASATESMALNAARDTFKFIERLYESAT